jgi:hypothetical protein
MYRVYTFRAVPAAPRYTLARAYTFACARGHTHSNAYRVLGIRTRTVYWAYPFEGHHDIHHDPNVHRCTVKRHGVPGIPSQRAYPSCVPRAYPSCVPCGYPVHVCRVLVPELVYRASTVWACFSRRPDQEATYAQSRSNMEPVMGAISRPLATLGRRGSIGAQSVPRGGDWALTFHGLHRPPNCTLGQPP